MSYLIAHCPMRGCDQRTPVCKLCAEAVPEFDPGLYLVVKCSACGQEFRELASRLEVTHSAPAARVA